MARFRRATGSKTAIAAATKTAATTRLRRDLPRPNATQHPRSGTRSSASPRLSANKAGAERPVDQREDVRIKRSLIEDLAAKPIPAGDPPRPSIVGDAIRQQVSAER